MNGEQDPNLDQELQEALGSLDIDSLMELEQGRDTASRGGAESLAEGVKRGRVIAVEPGEIFVDMGGKSQGLLTVDKWGKEGLPKVGDVIEVTVEGYDSNDGLLILSREGAVKAASWARLQEGDLVEARVTGHNKGGLEVDIGGIKGFIPVSHISFERVETDELSRFVNQKLRCAVVEIRRAERTLVVSRRDVLKREQEQLRRQAFETLQEGMVLSGTVKTIMPYGAFVDIGGIDGLLHIADMSHARIADPHEVVREGQQLEVKMLKIDPETRKIGLGLKQVGPDPWADADFKWRPDSVVVGKIVKLMDFGAFVQLEPGVEGLIPISEMSYQKRINHPREVVSEGQDLRVKVLNVDLARKRISLSLKRVEEDPWMGASLRWPADAIVEGMVTRTTEFGAFVQLTPGVEGLVHISEISDARIRSVQDAVKIGQQVRVKVLEVEEERRRIALSIKQAAMEAPQAVEDTAPPPPPKKRKKPLKGGLEW